MPDTQQERQSPLPQDPGRLFRRRMACGLTQKQLAELAHLSTQQMSQIERGVRGASPDSLLRIAKALNCPVEDLMPAEVKSA